MPVKKKQNKYTGTFFVPSYYAFKTMDALFDEADQDNFTYEEGDIPINQIYEVKLVRKMNFILSETKLVTQEVE